MADDAGALMVRSGLVSSSALDDARARVASLGGTLGEQLVTSGAIADDDLTDFYCSRLLVPQVNPNMLARLTPKVVATIPGDMAIELRAIPVSLDSDNNLTVAMSDPSDRHAVDEIAFFTGAYVVRAVATQMQIAWCLAHYYGHVTTLGQRLLRISQSPSATDTRPSRTKGLTGKVNATRHRAVAPITGPVDVLRPSSGQLDLRPLQAASSGSTTAAGSGQRPAVPAPAGSDLASATATTSARPAAAAPPGNSGVPDSSVPGKPATAMSPAGTAAPGASKLPAWAMAGAGAARAEDSTGVPKAGAGRSAGPADSPVGSTAGSRPATDAAMSAGTPTTLAASTAAGAGKSGSGAATETLVAPAGAAGSATAGAGTDRLTAAIVPTGSGAGKPAGSGSLAERLAAAGGGPAAKTPGSGSTSEKPGAAASVAGAAPAVPADPAGPMAAIPPGAAAPAGATPAEPTRAAEPTAHQAGSPAAAGSGPATPAEVVAPEAAAPRILSMGPNLPTLLPGAFSADDDALPMPVLFDEPSGNMASSSVLDGDGEDDAPERPRPRSISGEIRVPIRRAPSIKPPLPDDDDEPMILIERGSEDEPTVRRALPPRRRAVKSDPPELYARAGEVDLKTSGDRAIDADEPRIVVDEDALAPPTGRIDTRRARRNDTPALTTVDVLDDADTGAVIHDRIVDHDPQPILLDRMRPPSQLPPVDLAATGSAAAARDGQTDDDRDTGEIDIVVLDARKKPRRERRTRIGVPPAPVNARHPRDTDTTPVPAMEQRAPEVLDDPTVIDLRAAPPGDDTTSDQLAAPPAPASDADTNPHIVAAPPSPAARAPVASRPGSLPAVIVDDGYDDDDEEPGPRTSEMSAAELDDAIPERTTEIDPELLLRRRHHHHQDPVDDGWGPPGTTIPPPLLGAIPGSDDDDDHAGTIPMPNVDSSPLIVGPPSRPSAGEPAGRALVRALEEATARAIDVIRQLEHTRSRDEVVDVMISHLAENHHRAGFFVTRHAASKAAVELGLFAMTPRPAMMPAATLRLDRPSTLQDVVGTRLPYRGPMHDDASRAFLVSILGACPPEILLVPVAVRERVVGVLFGEHRLRHTFDDQIALSARAAGMALERILRARRG